MLQRKNIRECVLPIITLFISYFVNISVVSLDPRPPYPTISNNALITAITTVLQYRLHTSTNSIRSNNQSVSINTCKRPILPIV